MGSAGVANEFGTVIASFLSSRHSSESLLSWMTLKERPAQHKNTSRLFNKRLPDILLYYVISYSPHSHDG
jgi:hypothetical protein